MCQLVTATQAASSAVITEVFSSLPSFNSLRFADACAHLVRSCCHSSCVLRFASTQSLWSRRPCLPLQSAAPVALALCEMRKLQRATTLHTTTAAAPQALLQSTDNSRGRTRGIRPLHQANKQQAANYSRTRQVASEASTLPHNSPYFTSVLLTSRSP